MNPHTQDVPGTYVWEVPGRPAAVHIPLSVVDRLSAEIMRGYGATPKRNAEVGGVLIGSVAMGGVAMGSVEMGSAEQDSPAMIRIEDFEVVPCQYRLGPSYVFTEEDCGPFEQAAMRPGAIGYFRSHTREGMSLAVEDVELLDHFFPGLYTVALLVRPYATTASVAGFFIREKGTFPAATPLEFPFRRQELTGQEPPRRRSMVERRPRRSAVKQSVNQSVNQSLNQSVNPSAHGNVGGAVDGNFGRDSSPAAELPSPSDPGRNGHASESSLRTAHTNRPPAERNLPSSGESSQSSVGYFQSIDPQAEPAYAATPAARSRIGSGWVWIPLCFMFLLFGVALGFQAALLKVGARPLNSSANSSSAFSLALAVSESGQNLSVRWDRQAPAVRASRRGVLEIEEAGITKPVDLDAAQLQNGTLTYRHATNDVRFRLTVFPKDQVSVTESAEWRQ